ncbi:transposable element Tcb1 transposase [Trichonephila clavipes]|nr:transposable element Tcb1 transposase [Trichonephila clavipes]
MKAGWSARRVARQLSRSDCFCEELLGPVGTRDVIYTKTILRTPSTDQSSRKTPHRHLGSRCPLRVLPLMPIHRCHRLEWCHARGNWTAAEWNQVVFSRYNLSSDDNRVRVWKPRGERLNLPFAFQ